MADIKETPKDKVFQPDEAKVLDRSLDIRMKIVENMMSNGTPNDNRDIRVINELLNSTDALVLGKTDRRLKQESAVDVSETLAIIQGVLTASKHETAKRGIEQNPYIDVSLSEADLVIGEDKIGIEELDLADFAQIIEG